MPDTPTTNTQDLANTEYDAQRRARAAATPQPNPPDASPTSSDERAETDRPDLKGKQHG
ncbi:hypothetical protein MKL09_03420 [Methylobacterium sp. J-048]|uniref:hypothetical protein n=1 Tax=Methylobacterium sp. J-048 TaxID=2836635 RepID=UPI001FBC03A7|nr:hypothetical protein [Methylobacterium sp. J-048]MCJ2055600.1 hypothetical protein [Methylobacterium sp. J-048]